MHCVVRFSFLLNTLCSSIWMVCVQLHMPCSESRAPTCWRRCLSRPYTLHFIHHSPLLYAFYLTKAALHSDLYVTLCTSYAIPVCAIPYEGGAAVDLTLYALYCVVSSLYSVLCLLWRRRSSRLCISMINSVQLLGYTLCLTKAALQSTLYCMSYPFYFCLTLCEGGASVDGSECFHCRRCLVLPPNAGAQYNVSRLTYAFYIWSVY